MDLRQKAIPGGAEGSERGQKQPQKESARTLVSLPRSEFVRGGGEVAGRGGGPERGLEERAEGGNDL